MNSPFTSLLPSLPDGTAGAENPFETACRFWQLVFAGLTTTTFREKGGNGVEGLWHAMLVSHQQEAFLGGLDKLGIDRHGPPAVVAGQYHFLTNVIGGLHMQYVEETPQKVWNRNMGPMWSYPGLSMLALPAELRRAIMGAWHPNDGRLLGTRRLGWVITRTMMEGEPYDEGYFQEYPYDLADSQLVRHELAPHTPECDPSRQPRLDPATWPPIRIFKARRTYVRGYVTSALESLLARYGEQAAAYLLQSTMRNLATQFTAELAARLEIEGSTKDDCAAFVCGILRSCGQPFETRRMSDMATSILIKAPLLALPAGATESLIAAYMQFFAAAVRIRNGHVAVTCRFDGSRENAAVIELEDRGRWLW